MAKSVGSAAKRTSRLCLTFVKVTTPIAPRTPLPTKFAAAEKHTGYSPCDAPIALLSPCLGAQPTGIQPSLAQRNGLCAFRTHVSSNANRTDRQGPTRCGVLARPGNHHYR